MPENDTGEAELLAAYEKGALKSIATKAALLKFKAAARATAMKPSKAAPPTQGSLPRRARKADA